MINIDNETKELITAFTAESLDLIDEAELKIQNFIDCTGNDESVNTVFRAFHSIKGTASYLNFKNITSITHEAEALLDIFRKKNAKPSQVEIDIIYLACDILKSIIVKAEEVNTDKGFESDTKIISESIQQLIKNRTESSKKLINENNEENKKKKTKHDKKNKSKENEDDYFDILITKEIVEKSISESITLLERLEKNLLALEKNSDDKELISSIFRDIHTIKGNAGFIGIEEIEKGCIDLEEFLYKIKNEKRQINSDVVSFLLKQIDLIIKGFNDIQIDEKKKDKNGDKEQKKHKKEKKEEKKEYKRLGTILLEMGVVTKKNLKKALEIQNSRIGEILIDQGVASEDAVKKALEKQNSMNFIKGIETDYSIRGKEVRVNTEKLDKLFELAGELITAESMVIHNPEIAKLNIESFEKSTNYLSKITREIQEISMSMRMIPLEGIFAKAIRLVRDLSRKENKLITLKIIGQETEMDRKIIEELSDPLTHIIRNAIDHGIEHIEERKKKGKDEVATITLEAKYEGNEIWITIRDDGRGLNREKILKKAKEKNLIKGNGENLKDEEVWPFIFQAGFSTSEKVTDVSGRGVGMDVVKKNIEKLKGKISLRSIKGKKTEVILKIPLTLAIIDVITVNIADKLYSIPTIDIIEFIQVKEEQINYLQNKSQIIKLRNEVIPVIKLYDFFKIKTKKTALTEGVMVVIQRENKKAALFVDDILGNQQIVIKPLSETFEESKGLAGCSILGSGDVSLIIDSTGIIKESLE